jgi:HAMP domain-containing protein/signal transduction histidine kinase/CheY-like chemotaxis protein
MPSVKASHAIETFSPKELLAVLTAVKNGNFSVRMSMDQIGIAGKIADTINDIITQNETMAKEFQRISIMVGKEGKTTQRALMGTKTGSWAACINSFNSLIADLVQPTNEMARVIGAVAKGDLSQTMALELEGKPLQGEFLRSAKLVNGMVGQLSSFASEVTRVAREVGTEGKLGGQAEVKGVSGTWKDLTDNVNSMAGNLTAQVRNIANVTTAVANGDLTKKITVDVKGEILELKNTINIMVDQLSSFASEVTRVAREVGTEGKLGGQADVKGVSGTWKDLTDNVNSMAGNLTGQVRNIAEVTTAVANGDLTKKITVDVKGEILELKNTINIMVDQLNAFASEVTRVAREVGTEGKLGGQADVKGVSGTWKDLTDNVNSMAGNLTGQVRNIAEVTTAVANGDLTKKITVDVKGEILELKNTINIMVDQLSSFASEVTRVAREVGTEGKLGGQAVVKGVGGTWKDLTDNVNSMAGNLTGQVRNIAEVTTAVANGDLTKKITVDVKGEILELKDTINTMVDQLNAFASEVTRVAREVGTEGNLGGQAEVKGVSGTWKDLTDNVNSMAGNLTAQVRNIAEVTTAVANGDLTKKITVDVKGEILQLKITINTMVDQLNAFASEVTRVAREVGTEGKLGGQAVVKGVGGTWKDLTDNVNSMAGNLTGQVRNIAEVTTAVANGDLTKKITVDVKGEILELKNTINIMVDQLSSFASEVTRVAREVGTEGKLGGQAVVKGVGGTWKDLTDNVNSMAGNLTGQVRNIAEVTTAVANGDLTKKITVDVKGEILELKNTINIMVDQLNAFASEVTRVAREVGTEGKLGGQAAVKGVAGTWKDLTDNVNSMATNLTIQVRGIAKVVTAVANGDLARKLILEAKGEIAELAETINGMIETLSVFADQVTTVAREVGIEGKLGGQAHVPGAAGRWRDLTDNVNQLAGNLTTQVRAIADVATAVTQGDLTRSIAVQAAGEVASLKDNINEMIRNLKDTTRKNTEQDWLKTNLAKFTRMLQGQRDLLSVSKQILSELSPLVNAQHSIFYITQSGNENDNIHIKLLASYGHKERKHIVNYLKAGDGLVGQCVLEKERILLTEVPPDYIKISSGLGEASPLNIVVLPVVFEGQVKAVIELGSFNRFTEVHLTFLEQLTESIGIVLNTISATTRTEDLLKQSQSLTEELQSQQEELTETNKRLEQQAKTLQQSEELLKEQQRELQKANEELEERAELLSEQKNEVEQKNQEVEKAKRMLEEKAEQLALTSKYKSEFLANMSHELRTPLNSLLLLSNIMSENTDGNLTPKQIEYAQTIHSSGTDLLELINDILDLAKIESGTMAVEVDKIPFKDIHNFVERTFRQIAESKKLEFIIDLSKNLPQAIHTDGKRLQQVLKNLLSNAFKFTEKGQVTLKIEVVTSGWNSDNEILKQATTVVGFKVIDTGIGIAPEKYHIIFEAFQQADGTTNRKYGGTGLGLSISRQIAYMLGGEIHLSSELSQGSTFTLYLPIVYVPISKRSKPPLTQFTKSENEDNSIGLNNAIMAKQKMLANDVTKYDAVTSHETDIQLEDIQPDDKVVLIVENDFNFAQILLDCAHQYGLKGVVAKQASEALRYAREYRPVAITLDLKLLDWSGWVILDRFKHDVTTRHIPIHIISLFNDKQRGTKLGAMSFLQKPVSQEQLKSTFMKIKEFSEIKERHILLVQSNDIERQDIFTLLDNPEVKITSVSSGAEALAALKGTTYHGIVTGQYLADMKGFDLIKTIQEDFKMNTPPIFIVLTKKLNKNEYRELENISLGLPLKLVKSLPLLLDDLVTLLHINITSLKLDNQRLLEKLRRVDLSLSGKKVMIIDDDIRNIFAITSVLERKNIQAIYADNGKDGIKMLNKISDINVVLVDIMMPEMDGYETIQAIRKMPQFKTLPIIALTAKAMLGDREKCLNAGASDYLSKPVDVEQLFSLLRVWLYHDEIATNALVLADT